jgi:hypothetical protein
MTTTDHGLKDLIEGNKIDSRRVGAECAWQWVETQATALMQRMERYEIALKQIAEREKERIDRDRRINPNGLTEASLYIIASEALAGDGKP